MPEFSGARATWQKGVQRHVFFNNVRLETETMSYTTVRRNIRTSRNHEVSAGLLAGCVPRQTLKLLWLSFLIGLLPKRDWN